MTNKTSPVSVYDKLQISADSPEGQDVVSLLDSGHDGGHGEFDEPSDTLLRAYFAPKSIEEWECIDVGITNDSQHVVFYGLRIVWNT